MYSYGILSVGKGESYEAVYSTSRKAELYKREKRKISKNNFYKIE